MTLDKRVAKLHFAAQKWRRYHQRRAAFLKKCTLAKNILLCGAGIVLIPGVDPVFALLAPIVVALEEIVFHISDNYVRHEFMYNEFSDLESEIKTTPHTEEAYTRWKRKQISIEKKKEQSTIFRALEAYCHNEVVRITRRNEGNLVPLDSWGIRTMNLLPRTSLHALVSHPPKKALHADPAAA